MGYPAIRVGDMHICPMVTPGLPPIPHVGMPVVGPGCPTVLIGGMPAAVMGDICPCVGPPDMIMMGSMVVLIGGKPAARMMPASCTHPGATLISGCPTVMIGDGGGGGSGGAGGAGGGAPLEMVNTILNEAARTMSERAQEKVAQIGTLKNAAAKGTPFCEICK